MRNRRRRSAVSTGRMPAHPKMSAVPSAMPNFSPQSETPTTRNTRPTENGPVVTSTLVVSILTLPTEHSVKSKHELHSTSAEGSPCQGRRVGLAGVCTRRQKWARFPIWYKALGDGNHDCSYIQYSHIIVAP